MNAVRKHRELKRIRRYAQYFANLQAKLDREDAGVDVGRYVEMLKEPMNNIYLNVKSVKAKQ